MRDYNDDPPFAMLEEITDSEEVYRYVAFSVVWGYAEPYESSKENYLEHTDRVPWEYLSRAFQEAVALSLILEYEYIWIGSLVHYSRRPSRQRKRAAENELGLRIGRSSICFTRP